MKSYYLHSLAWFQLIAPVVFIGVLFFCANYEEACNCLRFIGEPLYYFDLSMEELYQDSFIFVLFYFLLFVLASVLVAGIIAPIVYFAKKKAPMQTAFWVKNLLVSELFFMGFLLITCLLWLLPHHEYYNLSSDITGDLYLRIALVYFPLFWLGNYLRKRKLTMVGNTFLIFSGIALAFGLCMSYCAFRMPEYALGYAYSNFNVPQEVNEDEFGVVNDTIIDDYDDYGGGEEEEPFEWDKVQFNADSLAKILSDKRYDSLTQVSHFTKYLKAPNKQLKRQHPTLNRLAEIVGRDNNRLAVFWYTFRDELLRYLLPQKGKEGKATAFTIRLYANELLTIYHQMEDSAPDVYEDILDVMILQKPLEEQLERLRPIFERYDIADFEKALDERDAAFVRWAYTFWARRYYENNISITLTVINQLVLGKK